MSEPLAVALVGCGRLAQAGYLPALAAARGVRLAAVADPDATRRDAAAAAARTGSAGAAVGAFPALGDLLEDAAVDAVVLATPAAAHLADARVAAAAGVPTLVEKPPAPDAAGAAALAALDPAPWIAFNRRFGAGPGAVRAALAGRDGRRPGGDRGPGGSLGGDRRPGGAPGPRAAPPPPTPPAGATRRGGVELLLELRYRRASWGSHTVGDDALLDLGPHLVDLARWLTGDEVTGVRAAGLSHERAEVELALQRGSATLRCAADRPHRELLEARGEGGELLARHGEGGLVKGLRARLTRGGSHPLVTSLVEQLEAFGRAVRGEEAFPLATAADGHAVMAVVDAVRACAAGGGRPVDRCGKGH